MSTTGLSCFSIRPGTIYIYSYMYNKREMSSSRGYCVESRNNINVTFVRVFVRKYTRSLFWLIAIFNLYNQGEQFLGQILIVGYYNIIKIIGTIILWLCHNHKIIFSFQ